MVVATNPPNVMTLGSPSRFTPMESRSRMRRRSRRSSTATAMMSLSRSSSTPTSPGSTFSRMRARRSSFVNNCSIGRPASLIACRRCLIVKMSHGKGITTYTHKSAAESSSSFRNWPISSNALTSIMRAETFEASLQK